MNKEQALDVLLQAVQLAQQKGAYTLQDARVIGEAFQTLAPKPDITDAKATSEVTSSEDKPIESVEEMEK